MAKKDKGGERGIDWDPWYMGMRVDLSEPKGEFRNVFEDVIEQMKESKSNTPKSE